MTKRKRCKICGGLRRYPEDLDLTIDGQYICGYCEPMEPRGEKIREYFRPPRGDPGRREAPPGGSPTST